MDTIQKNVTVFHTGAKSLTTMLPNAEYRALEGRDHSAVLMASHAIADVVEAFFLNRK